MRPVPGGSRVHERMSNLAIGMPGTWEILILVGVLLLFFGARKLPELARAMGSSITQFKKGIQDVDANEKLPPSPGARTGSTLKPGEAHREGTGE